MKKFTPALTTLLTLVTLATHSAKAESAAKPVQPPHGSIIIKMDPCGGC